MTLHLCGLPPNPCLWSNCEKKHQTNSNRGASYKIPDQYTLKTHQKQGKFEKLS